MARKRLTLLGMAPSGEACLVSSADNEVWLSSIYAPVTRVPESDIDQIIAEHDWIRVNRHFSSWPDLVSYRDRHAVTPPPRFPNMAAYSADEVRDALEETRTAHTLDERAAARALLVQILRHSHVVLRGRGLYYEVLTRLEQLADAVDPTAPPSAEVAEAIERYQLAAA